MCYLLDLGLLNTFGKTTGSFLHHLAPESLFRVIMGATG